MINEDDIAITDKTPTVTVGELKNRHAKLTYTKPDQLVVLADGLDNFFDYVFEKMTDFPYGYKSSIETDNGEFHAFSSYDEACDIFRNRPQEIVDFDPGELKIKDNDESGNKVDFDVIGDYIDMGRYMEGIPETWGTMHNGNARNRRVNLIINLTHMGRLEHKYITHRGERILRLVDALEAGGVRTQITGVESSQTSHTEIVLKKHSDPLTITDLAVVSHPEFLRRIIFRVTEQSKTCDWGYGDARVFGLAVESHAEMLHPDVNDEINVFIDGNMTDIDKGFDKLEKLLVWELSKEVPEVDAIRISSYGELSFAANGYRAASDIRREGLEVIGEEE